MYTNEKLEGAIIGGMLIDKNTAIEVIDELKVDDLEIKEHKKIFNAINKLLDEGQEVDIITVNKATKINLEYLANLVDILPSTTAVNNYVKQIKEASKGRILKNKLNMLCTESRIDLEQIKGLIQEAEEKQQEETEVYTIDKLKGFLKTVNKNKEKELISTGFLKFNELLGGGLYSGLYAVGGISSLGKTAFILQMADYIAMRENDVIFFSLEMGENELIARSLSRILFDLDRYKFKDYGTLKIMRGQFNNVEADIDLALQKYEVTAKNLIIKEGNFNTNIQSIRKTISKHIRTGKKPVVIIDYLQILKGVGNLSDKQEIDLITAELKRISRDFDIAVIVISSFNRQSYHNQVNFEAFKESGGIEYTADCVIGLQLSKLDEMTINSKGATAEQKEEINEAKSKSPREVTGVILKNRNGKAFVKQKFLFYPANNFFREV